MRFICPKEARNGRRVQRPFAAPHIISVFGGLFFLKLFLEVRPRSLSAVHIPKVC